MKPKRATLDPMPDEQPKRELVAAIKPDEWAKLSDAEKQKFCDDFNAHVNEKRKRAGLPPLPKRPA